MSFNRKSIAHFAVSLLTLLLLSGTTAVFCQKGTPKLEAIVDQEYVPMGAYFEVQFRLQNGNGQNFRPPSFIGFQKLAGPTMMSSTTIVNGQYSQSVGWGYTLRAIRPGKFTIEEASVSVGGQSIRSQPIAIEVVASSGKSAAPQVNVAPNANGREDLFVSAQISKQNVWMGQQLVLNYVLYTRTSVESYDVLGEPKFEGFYAKEMARFDSRTREETVKGQRYAVRTLRSFALFPQQTGTLKIEPMRFQFAVSVRGASNDPISAFFGNATQPVVIESQGLEIKSKSLPEPVPDHFCGGVGQYQWTVEADKTALSTDDALTLTLALRGNGDGKRFANPKFALPPELEAYEPKAREEETYENGEEVIHAKTLEYAILPKQAGEYEFRPELVFFDPDSARYVTKKSPKPIKISVTQGKQGRKTLDPSAIPDNIAALRAPTHLFRQGDFWILSPWFWLLLLLPVLGLGGYYFLQNRKAQQAAAIAASPTLRAKAQSTAARIRLTQAHKQLAAGNAKAFYDELSKSLYGYLSAKTGIPVTALNKFLIQEKLAERGVSPQHITALQSVLQSCEMALFAGQTPSDGMEKTFRQAEMVVGELEGA